MNYAQRHFLYMRTTDLRQTKRGTFVRAEYGLHKIGDQAPYCSLTGSEYDGRLIASGQITDTVLEVFPELAPFAKWHLCTDGIPLHYIANALFWFDMANGDVERRTYDPDPLATLIKHCVPQPGEDWFALLATGLDRLELTRVLVRREPMLRAAFRAEVVVAFNLEDEAS